MLNLIGTIIYQLFRREAEMEEDENTYKELRVAICSERRRAVLLSLIEGKKPLVDLHKELKSSSPALIHALRELEEHHLVRQDQMKQYELTFIGKSAARKVIDFQRTMEVLMQHEAFWSGHDLSGIPDHLFDRIASLRDTTLITGTALDVFKAMRHFVELLQNSGVVKLVSSIYIPNIASIVLEKEAEELPRVELVLTEAVLRHLIGEAKSERWKAVRSEHLKLRVLHDDPKLVVVVTDRFMALASYRTDGAFDHSSTLTSEHPAAIAWGGQLFDYYVSKSASVVL
jgi:predicted transcriptional regulator